MKKLLLFIFVLGSLLQAQMAPSAVNKLKSLILPGWGEYNIGHKDLAQSFFIREAVLWLVCIGGKKASNWYKSDYHAFAELHADVNMAGKDYLFAVNIGHYDNFTEFNETKNRMRLGKETYPEGKGKEWQWDSTNNRIHFDEMRIQSVTYDKFTNFAIGGLVLHRIISFIDVIYLERKYPTLNFNPQVSFHTGDIRCKLTLDL